MEDEGRDGLRGGRMEKIGAKRGAGGGNGRKLGKKCGRGKEKKNCALKRREEGDKGREGR